MERSVAAETDVSLWICYKADPEDSAQSKWPCQRHEALMSNVQIIWRVLAV